MFAMVKAVKERYRCSLLAKGNVVACGVGYKEVGGGRTDELCVVVSVVKKLPTSFLHPHDRIPPTIGSVRTDVQETGIIRALPLPTDRWRPAPGGVSIGHLAVTAGTLGCLVRRDGEVFILSNNHVLANCFDEKTEVLTKSGWQAWHNVHQDTLFATRAVDGTLEYQRPTSLIKQQYQGEMLHFQGRWHDLMVTPNHRLLVKKTYRTGTPKHMKGKVGYANYIPIPAIDAFNRCRMKFASIEMTSQVQWNCAPLPDPILPPVEYIRGKDHNRKDPIPVGPWLEFLGLFLGDGSATIRPKVMQYITQIRCTDADKRKHIMKVCDKMGFSAFENGGAVRITSKQLTLYLATKFGKTERKRIPREILDAPPEQLACLWKGIMASDGWIGNHGQELITQKNAALIDDLQEVALKLGKGAWIKRIDGSPYNPQGIYWNLRTCRTSFTQHQEINVVDYDGLVYCADVPNGTLMVRRNGKPSWSCNSNNAELGDPIVQPGTYDGGSAPDDEIATLEEFVHVKFLLGNLPDCPVATGVAKVTNLLARFAGSKHRLRAYQDDPLATNLVDAAIARPLDVGLVEDRILEIGTPNGVAEGVLGLPIVKSGRTTGFTTGEITQVAVTVQVMYPPNSIAVFEDQLMAGDMCAGGDSGSAILDTESHVVGLLFAGGEGITIFNRIQNVMEELGVVI